MSLLDERKVISVVKKERERRREREDLNDKHYKILIFPDVSGIM